MTYEQEPIVNPGEHEWTPHLYRMWAGEFSTRKVLVWADNFETAFEHLVEWLDVHAPGLLTKSAEYEPCDCDDDGWPVDHTIIGHTTLNNGNCIASWCWGGDQVTDEATIAAVRSRSDASIS